jgi:hypothetical protein
LPDVGLCVNDGINRASAGPAETPAHMASTWTDAVVGAIICSATGDG